VHGAGTYYDQRGAALKSIHMRETRLHRAVEKVLNQSRERHDYNLFSSRSARMFLITRCFAPHSP